MADPLLDILRKTRPDGSGNEGPVSVLIALNIPALDDAVRRRLEAIGLQVRSATANKLVGTIDARKLADLRKDVAIREVEVAQRLKPHSAR